MTQVPAKIPAKNPAPVKAPAGIPDALVAALEEILVALTPKQRQFVRLYLANGRNGAEAARLAGYGGKQNVKSAAYITLRRPAVKEALAKYETLLTKRAAYDFNRASEELLAASAFARATGNATALVRATELLAKLHGHLNDRVDVAHRGDVAFIFPDRRAGALSNG